MEKYHDYACVCVCVCVRVCYGNITYRVAPIWAVNLVPGTLHEFKKPPIVVSYLKHHLATFTSSTLVLILGTNSFDNNFNNVTVEISTFSNASLKKTISCRR